MPSEPEALGGHAGLWAADLGLLARLRRLAARRVTLEIEIYSRPQSDIELFEAPPLPGSRWHEASIVGTPETRFGAKQRVSFAAGNQKYNPAQALLP
jgi:hypothetical protein